jgi:hypothetical protein
VAPGTTNLPGKQNKSNTCVMPLIYLPPINFYQIMLKHKFVKFDIQEHFHKQYYFNRCKIYGANGILKLSVPVIRNHEKIPLKEKIISYHSNWRTIHWRSIEAAYRRSPFFEFYEDKLKPIYEEYKPEYLTDWNLKLFETVNKLLDVKICFSFTETYHREYENMGDYRAINSPKVLPDIDIKEISYQQVFQERFGFITNLSIIDLLFCEGNRAKALLMENS